MLGCKLDLQLYFKAGHDAFSFKFSMVNQKQGHSMSGGLEAMQVPSSTCQFLLYFHRNSMNVVQYDRITKIGDRAGTDLHSSSFRTPKYIGLN